MFVDFFRNGRFFIEFYLPSRRTGHILISQCIDEMNFASLDDKLRFLLIPADDFES